MANQPGIKCLMINQHNSRNSFGRARVYSVPDSCDGGCGQGVQRRANGCPQTKQTIGLLFYQI